MNSLKDDSKTLKRLDSQFTEGEIKKLKEIIYKDEYRKFGIQITDDLKTIIVELRNQKLSRRSSTSSDCLKILSFLVNWSFGIMIGLAISFFLKPLEFLK